MENNSQEQATNPPTGQPEPIPTPEPTSAPTVEPQPKVNPKPTIEPQPTTEPVIAPEVLLPTYQTPKDPRMIRLVAGGIIALIIVIGLAITLKQLNNQATTSSDVESSSSSETQKKEKGLTESEKQAIVKNVFQEIKKTLPEDETKYSVQDIYDTTFPNYLATGAKTPMPLEKSYGIIISIKDDKPEDLTQSIATDAKASTIKQGFTSYTDGGKDSKGNTGWLNKDLKVLCTPITNNETSVSLSCGYTSWLSAEKIALGNALAEAYKTTEEEYPAVIDANPSDIENSPYRPYQKITATMLDKVGLFYRPSSDGDWVFFGLAKSGGISCSEFYSDSGARHAFQGEVCLDADGALSTVSESN